MIAEKGKLLPADGKSACEQRSLHLNHCFLSVKGTERNQRLGRSGQVGISIIPANPKTSGAARWTYLAAWGYTLKKNNGDEAKARDFVARFYKNVPVLDTAPVGRQRPLCNAESAMCWWVGRTKPCLP